MLKYRKKRISIVFFLKIFHDVAYRARNRQDLLAGRIYWKRFSKKISKWSLISLGIDDFLDHVTVLPPGEWDPKTRIEPPKSVPNKVRNNSLIKTSIEIG